MSRHRNAPLRRIAAPANASVAISGRRGFNTPDHVPTPGNRSAPTDEEPALKRAPLLQRHRCQRVLM